MTRVAPAANAKSTSRKLPLVALSTTARFTTGIGLSVTGSIETTGRFNILLGPLFGGVMYTTSVDGSKKKKQLALPH
jgi:ethanolamine transporter EutH